MTVVKNTPLSRAAIAARESGYFILRRCRDLEFEAAYTLFMEKHRKTRQGEQLRRLIEGHKHGEKMLLENVWWPAFQNFDDLYPEYEVSDFKDGTRYLDYAFLVGNIMLNIEVDGFNSHAKSISRSKFSDNLMRQNHLILDGWKVIRFSYDDVVERPRMCQQILQQFMGRWISGRKNDQISALSAEERDILRLGLRRSGKLYTAEVCHHLTIGEKKARKLLHGLLDVGLLLPPGDRTTRIRIRYYRLSSSVTPDLLGI
jgi:hypothetical protein